MAESEPGYRVVPAAEEHLEALPAIERAAATLFAGMDLDAAVLEDHTSLEEFADAREDGLLWVAITRAGSPVGFALADEHGSGIHLEEVDVHPDHGRRGLGARLVRAVCDFAHRADHDVTLTTFRDVPWNRPFYEGLGFSVVAPAELSQALRAIVAEEAERGLDPEQRVVMRWRAPRP